MLSPTFGRRHGEELLVSTVAPLPLFDDGDDLSTMLNDFGELELEVTMTTCSSMDDDDGSLGGRDSSSI